MREKSLNESKCTVALTNKVKQLFPYGGVIVSVVITQHGRLKVKPKARESQKRVFNATLRNYGRLTYANSVFVLRKPKNDLDIPFYSKHSTP